MWGSSTIPFLGGGCLGRKGRRRLGAPRPVSDSPGLVGGGGWVRLARRLLSPDSPIWIPLGWQGKLRGHKFCLWCWLLAMMELSYSYWIPLKVKTEWDQRHLHPFITLRGSRPRPRWLVRAMVQLRRNEDGLSGLWKRYRPLCFSTAEGGVGHGPSKNVWALKWWYGSKLPLGRIYRQISYFV